MLIFELEDQTRIAVRGSGTEPKIKYYLFAQRRPNESKFAEQLSQIKIEVSEHLESLWEWLQKDAHTRAGRDKLLDSRQNSAESFPWLARSSWMAARSRS